MSEESLDCADISVVIVNWNSGEHLKHCLDSLSHQSMAPDKIFLVDNASSDDSLDLADLSNVTLIRLDDNTGFAKANNVAISQCQTRWFATLNPDAQAKPDWIKSLFAGANRFGPSTMFACCQLKQSDQAVYDGTGDVYHVSGLAWRRSYGNALNENVKPQELFSPCAAAAMYPTEAVRSIGGFDEDYFCYFEDVDLAFRLRHLGLHCEYLPDAVVSHVGYASSGENSPFTLYHGHRNLVWTYFKNMPARLLWKHLLQHIGLSILSIFYYGVKGHTLTMLKAKIHALAEMPNVFRKRKSVMQSSLVDAGQLKSHMQQALLPQRNRNGR